MTPVAQNPVNPGSSGSRLLTGLLVLAVGGLVFLVMKWPEPPPDTQPPTSPGALDLGETTCKSIALSWAGSTDDRDVTGYDVYRDGQIVASAAADTRTASVATSSAGTWNVVVKARDAAGNVSPPGETVVVTLPPCGSDAKAPSSPGGVKATADGTTVTMAWEAATDDVGVAAYDVFRDGTRVGGVGSEQLTFIDFGLAASSTHRYQISARDQQGNASARSKAVDVTAGKECTLLCGVTTVARDPALVWGLAELPDGSVVYSRRDTFEIVRLDPRTGQTAVLGKVPGAAGTRGDGGVLGLAVARTFHRDRLLYVFHTTATDNRVVRMRITADALDTGSLQPLVVGIPRGRNHNGGRIRFGPDGKLYVATGDADNPKAAQNNASLAGKVLRFNPDGSVPAGNPFGGYIWSLGHRNPQGLAFDSGGALWMQESGDATTDEINHVVKGGNYGWPACDGTESKAGLGCQTPGYQQPHHLFYPGEGSCSGNAVVRDILYIACVNGSRLFRIDLAGDAFSAVRPLLAGTYGQLRTVEPGSGGTLWLTASDGATGTQLLRITLPPAG